VAVLERSRRVWTLPVRWEWSDVGTWESLASQLGVAPGRSRIVAGSVVYDDAGGNLVWGRPERPIALLGVEGLAVVDTGDALLVTRLDRSAEVREVVRALKRRGRSDVT
jgi:mannose-1-phosphate guanylyltransferase